MPVLNDHPAARTVALTPAAATPANTPQLRVMAVALAVLKPHNELIVKVADDRHAGFLLAAISILVETP